MLVLSRKSSETIHIGNNIIITIVSIQGKRVKIGIDAPDDVKISRGELVEPVPIIDQQAKPRQPGKTSATSPSRSTVNGRTWESSPLRSFRDSLPGNSFNSAGGPRSDSAQRQTAPRQ